MSVFTESTHLKGNFEPFRNVHGIWLYNETCYTFFRHHSPASITFYTNNRPTRGTNLMFHILSSQKSPSCCIWTLTGTSQSYSSVCPPVALLSCLVSSNIYKTPFTSHCSLHKFGRSRSTISFNNLFFFLCVCVTVSTVTFPDNPILVSWYQLEQSRFPSQSQILALGEKVLIAH